MITEHNRQQRKRRLQREIEHFRVQMTVFDSQANPQAKRCYTLARRCLKRRTEDLAKLEA